MCEKLQLTDVTLVQIIKLLFLIRRFHIGVFKLFSINKENK